MCKEVLPLRKEVLPLSFFHNRCPVQPKQPFSCVVATFRVDRQRNDRKGAGIAGCIQDVHGWSVHLHRWAISLLCWLCTKMRKGYPPPFVKATPLSKPQRA